MDIWGRCGTCERWFYCPMDGTRAESAWSCPVCGKDPVAIENRATRVATASAAGG